MTLGGIGGELIPLFPLGTPLFPGVVLPLHDLRAALPPAGARPDSRCPRAATGGSSAWSPSGRAGRSSRSPRPRRCYDVGCTARVQVVAPPAGRRLPRSSTVGGERFRLLDVVVGEDPPYLQGEVEWLAERARRPPRRRPATPPGWSAPAPRPGRARRVVTEVARGSLDVLARNVRDLFARYVAEVAVRQGGPPGAARRGARRAAPTTCPTTRPPARWRDRGTAARGGEDAGGAVLPGRVLGAAHHRGPAGAAGRVGHPAPAGAESRLLRRELTLLRRSAPCRCRCGSSPPR